MRHLPLFTEPSYTPCPNIKALPICAMLIYAETMGYNKCNSLNLIPNL